MSSNRNICSVAERRRATLRWASLALVIFVAGCGRREAPPPPRPTPPPPISRDRALPTTSYVATAASIDLYDIRAGEMAMQRSSNPRLRDYAARLVEDHRGTAAQLSFAGRRLNLLPSAVFAPPHQALIDALATAGDFDTMFIRQQTDVHRDSQRMHAAYAARGDSQTLRPVAANAAQVEARHLAALRSL